MARYRLLLRCIGEAVALHGPRALLGLVPFGEHLFDIARDAHARYRQQCSMPEAVARVEAIAQAPVAEVQAEARAVVAEIRAAADPGEAAQLADPKLEQALVAYLAQVPAVVRASLRRPADPTGKSLPAGFSVQRPEDFLKLLPARPPRFQPGDTVVNGQWRLEELLGVGGFGEVWKARHATDPKEPPVALKFCLDPEAARYLRNEARLMDRVKREARGPGIVQLKQVYLENDPPCLSYEFVNGGDVTGLMHDWLALPLEKRVPLASRVVFKLARIMTPLHRLAPPIVHRDLKPANLLVVRKEGKRFDLKVADFGISGQAARQAVAAATRGVSRGDLLSQSLRGSHTPLYASPEQMRGGPPDPRDDVHALGVIWYQLLTCDLQRAVGVDFEEDLRELNVPGDTAALIRRCMARADRRFADAGELAEAIAALAPVEEEAPPPRPRWRPSKQLVLAGACVVGLLLLFVAAVLGLRLARTPQANPVPEASAHPEHGADDEAEGRVGTIKVPPRSTPPVPVVGKVAAGTKAGELTRVTVAPGVEMTFAWCPPGSFLMGSPKDDKEWTPFDNQHRVTLTQGYWLGVYEVTQKQWQAVMGDNPSNFKGDHLPVEQVSWDDCQAFCTKLGAKTGKRFRLPTEAEWEYACRAGTTTPFHFGDTISTDQANYEGFFTYGRGTKGQSRNKTTPVGSFAPNAWGLYDMHGNVEEWCQDRSEAYPSGDVTDPQGPATGARRVMRGGSWSSQPAYCRSAFRNGVVPDHRRREVGCRVVLCVDLPAPPADQGRSPGAGSTTTARPPASPPVPLTENVVAGTKAGELTRVTIAPGVEMTFAWCPPGTFQMGSPPDEEGRQEDETQYKVTLTQGYWLGVHEVTQKQWKAVTGDSPSNFKGDDLPVEQVSWDDCQAFCQKLGEKTGKRFRLPTEAEWEYACRAGTTTPFHFGDTISTDQANYLGSPAYGRGRTGTNRRATTPVGTFPANAWGLHDMHGNVWEWCADWYGDYPAGDAKDPRGPASGGSRVSRGGSWCTQPKDCRSGERRKYVPGDRPGLRGCRVVLCLN